MTITEEKIDHRAANNTSSAAEMDGPAGAGMTGGDVTPPQDAEAASEEHNQQRVADEEMKERQGAGEVDTQTDDLKPSAAQPEKDESEASSEDETSAQLKSAKTQLVQMAADFDNYRKMASRRESEVRERATRGIIEDFLPVLDNFERAVESSQNARDVEAVRVGVEYILKQFQEALAAHGVEPIESAGAQFDPLRHDALERVADSGQPSGTVIAQTQRGYIYRGQVLRPSRVQVAE